MRMPRKYGFSLGTRMSPHETTHHVELWAQPVHRWLISRAYHRYESVAFRMPGFGRLERWLQRRDGSPDHVPLSCRHDIMCYRLRQRDRTNLATLPIDPDTHEKIREFKYPKPVRSP